MQGSYGRLTLTATVGEVLVSNAQKSFIRPSVATSKNRSSKDFRYSDGIVKSRMRSALACPLTIVMRACVSMPRPTSASALESCGRDLLHRCQPRSAV